MKYISTKEATKLSGYTADHISRLARQGVVVAYREGRRWWIDRDSLKLFMLTNEALERNRRKEASDSYRHEVIKRKFLKHHPLTERRDILVFSIGDRLEAFWIATATTSLLALLLVAGLHFTLGEVRSVSQVGQTLNFDTSYQMGSEREFIGVVATTAPKKW